MNISKKEHLTVLYNFPQKPEQLSNFILSFLSPLEEENLRREIGDSFLSARDLCSEIRGNAIKHYVDIIANIGIFKNEEGTTLRESLKSRDNFSYWWFHKTSEKDFTVSRFLKDLIHVFIIEEAMSKNSLKSISLIGGKKEIADVLSEKYVLKHISPERRKKLFLIKAILSRLIYILKNCWHLYHIHSATVGKKYSQYDVVFSGFWDWSFYYDYKNNNFIDKYFQSLPNQLIRKGYNCGWFVWFSPNLNESNRGKTLKEVLAPLKYSNNVIFPQSFLTYSDVLKTGFNFKPLFIYLQFTRNRHFRKMFNNKGLNFLPLVKKELIRHFTDSIISLNILKVMAFERASSACRPRITFSFLELFLHSRAFYAGTKKSLPDVINCAIQHTLYCRDKTNIILRKEIEYNGEPDNCPVPKPDYIFAMGKLSADIFEESGFEPKRIYVTGSCRYDNSLKNIDIEKNKVLKSCKCTILIPTTFNVAEDLETIEAIYLASEGINGIFLKIRSHPYLKLLEDDKRFLKFKDRVIVSKKTLAEDLMEADMVFINYSTVGVEALLSGTPVWQWLPVGFNTSVFRDIPVIKYFTSVSSLHNALREFVNSPELFKPGKEIRGLVLPQCFYKADGLAAKRITDICHQLIGYVYSCKDEGNQQESAIDKHCSPLRIVLNGP